jgi:hypothetical protein
MIGTTDNKRVVGQAFQPDPLSPGQARKPDLQGWLLAVLALSALAALLLFCHGCHGDVDDELFAPTAASVTK